MFTWDIHIDILAQYLQIEINNMPIKYWCEFLTLRKTCYLSYVKEKSLGRREVEGALGYSWKLEAGAEFSTIQFQFKHKIMILVIVLMSNIKRKLRCNKKLFYVQGWLNIKGNTLQAMQLQSYSMCKLILVWSSFLMRCPTWTLQQAASKHKEKGLTK